MAKKKTVASAEERGFLDALQADAKDAATRLAYADWLEERGRPYEAMLQRVEAGVSQARYKIRRKSDGLFSDGRQWTVHGKEWRKASHVRSHMAPVVHDGRYRGTALNRLEIVVYEIRPQQIVVLPVTEGQRHVTYAANLTIAEPLAGGGPGA